MVTGFRDLLKTLEKHKWVSLCGEAPAQARIRTVPARGCKTLPGWLNAAPCSIPTLVHTQCRNNRAPTANAFTA